MQTTEGAKLRTFLFLGIVVTALMVIAGGQATGVVASSAAISIAPSSQTQALDTTFTVTVTQDADVTTTALQTNISFDPLSVHITNITTGGAYSTAGLIMGVAPQSPADAMAEANRTGTLKNVAAYYLPQQSTVSPGLTDVFVLTVRACKVSTSSVTLSNYKMLDGGFELVPAVTPHGGSVTVSGSAADADSDGITDSCDNCPNWPNATQALPTWTVPAGDSDCDGWPDSAAASGKAPESFIGTNGSHCPATATANDEGLPDTWPADFNDDQLVNGSDVLAFNTLIGSTAPGPPYSVRFDLDGDGTITVGDKAFVSALFGKRCA